MLRNSIVFGALLAVGGLPASAAVTYFGPTPYAQRSDSPFAQAITEGTVRLENFEDGLLNTGFAFAGCGRASNELRPSVDEDDGIIDGFGIGRTWSNSFLPACDFGLDDFRFEPDSLGRLPNFVGFVVVGPGSGEFVDGGFLYRAKPSIFDANGIELSDGRFFELPDYDVSISQRSTYYSRFIGFTSEVGIARLMIGGVAAVDHLQYGYLIPEPSVALLAAAVLGLAAFRRRRA
jgi:hypothetical protein